MSKRILIVAFAIAAVLPATASAAAINCNIVNRELKLGKWPADVALGMGITLADVKSCKDKPAAPVRSAPPARSASPASKQTTPAKPAAR
jgi:hypothetical protein